VGRHVYPLTVVSVS